MTPRLRHTAPLSLLAALLLSACSSSLPDDPAPNLPINLPPTFTSDSTVSVAENTTGTIYTATATDPNGDVIRFRLSATGADSTLFDLDRVTGALSFVEAPDFEAPADADADNVYEVDILVEDFSQASSTLLLRVTVTDVDEGSSAEFKQVGASFNAPVSVGGLRDGSDNLLVWEREGKAWIFDSVSGVVQTVPFLDVGEPIRAGGIPVSSHGSPGAAVFPAENPRSFKLYSLFEGRTDMADPSTVIGGTFPPSAPIPDVHTIDYEGAVSELKDHQLRAGPEGRILARPKEGGVFIPTPHLPTVEGLSALGTDDEGELLAATEDGRILRLVVQPD